MMQRKQLEEIAATVKGVPVWGCLPGSTAAEAGVRYGDIVLAVNGVPTPSIVEYLEGRKLRTDGFELRRSRVDYADVVAGVMTRAAHASADTPARWLSEIVSST